MGDLVKRLRSGLTHNNQTWPEMCNEAADVIESLTARLAEAEEALRGNAAFIKAQAEERARVRAETLEEAAKVADADAEIDHDDSGFQGSDNQRVLGTQTTPV